MIELIKLAAAKGAHLFSNVSGGKDGQAMTRILVANGFPIHSMIHADLGKIEWEQSHQMCQRQADELGLPLVIIKRRDGLGLLDLMERRKNQLAGQGKPFWPSSSSRYCTSDTKRDPINVFYRNHSHDFIISCEGIRAQESTKREKMQPLQVNKKCSSKIYHDMSPEQAIQNYQPGKRLVIKWFPIFNFTADDVWATYGNTAQDLQHARQQYQATGMVPASWNFHPAYVFGNERVSCVFCVLAKGCGDLTTGAKHRPDLLKQLAGWEVETGFTFQQNFSLQSLLHYAN